MSSFRVITGEAAGLIHVALRCVSMYVSARSVPIGGAGRSVGWSVVRPVNRWVGESVSRRSVGRSVGRSVDPSLGRSVVRSVDRSVGRSDGRWVGRLVSFRFAESSRRRCIWKMMVTDAAGASLHNQPGKTRGSKKSKTSLARGRYFGTRAARKRARESRRLGCRPQILSNNSPPSGSDR